MSARCSPATSARAAISSKSRMVATSGGAADWAWPREWGDRGRARRRARPGRTRLRGDFLGHGREVHEHAVAQHRRRDGADVIERHRRPAVDHGPGLRRQHQRLAGAGAGAQRTQRVNRPDMRRRRRAGLPARSRVAQSITLSRAGTSRPGAGRGRFASAHRVTSGRRAVVVVVRRSPAPRPPRESRLRR